MSPEDYFARQSQFKPEDYNIIKSFSIVLKEGGMKTVQFLKHKVNDDYGVLESYESEETVVSMFRTKLENNLQDAIDNEDYAMAAELQQQLDAYNSEHPRGATGETSTDSD